MNKFFAPLILALALTLTACAGPRSPGSTATSEQPRHFDFNQGVVAIDAGRAALKTGNYDGAIASLETGLALWPVHQPAWAALSEAYGMKGDTEGATFAAYFAERIEWANALHGTTAALAFDNVGLIHKEKPYVDLRIPQTAALLSMFYRQGQARISGAAN